MNTKEIKEMTRLELTESIRELWGEMGRDVDALKVDNKSDEKLRDGLIKLKAIKMGFGLLFKQEGNHKLAIHLLAEVFLKKQNEQKHEIDGGA